MACSGCHLDPVSGWWARLNHFGEHINHSTPHVDHIRFEVFGQFRDSGRSRRPRALQCIMRMPISRSPRGLQTCQPVKPQLRRASLKHNTGCNRLEAASSPARTDRRVWALVDHEEIEMSHPIGIQPLKTAVEDNPTGYTGSEAQMYESIRLRPSRSVLRPRSCFGIGEQDNAVPDLGGEFIHSTTAFEKGHIHRPPDGGAVTIQRPGQGQTNRRPSDPCRSDLIANRVDRLDQPFR